MKQVNYAEIWFFPFWALLASVFWLLIRRAKTAQQKLRIQRIAGFVAGGIFFLITLHLVATGLPPVSLFLVVPVLSLICYLNYHFTAFCEQCGRRIFNPSLGRSRIAYCPHCGTQLPKPI